VVRPSLNVTVAPDVVARSLKVARGALVQGVPPSSAAAAAGLLPTRRCVEPLVLLLDDASTGLMACPRLAKIGPGLVGLDGGMVIVCCCDGNARAHGRG
jgi:S1-C subfamily serine protease